MSPGDERFQVSGHDALLERAKAGEPGAFEEIFRQNRNQIYSLAYRMTGNQADAEDLCQDVFLTAFRKIGSFQGRSSFSTWLYRVAINRSKDFLRKKKRGQELQPTDDHPIDSAARDTAERIGEAGGPEAGAIASEAKRLVQDGLMRLPANLRAPLVLHELEEMQYHEIAALLRLPVGTVKSRIFRARVRLAEILEPHKEQWL